MATIERDNIGLLNDRITVRLSKEDYLPTFEKKVKEYSKNANIPGFRKGMVPTGLVKKMYGPSIFTDEVLKTVEKELRQYLQTTKPDIFAQPMALDNPPEKMDFNNPADYAFGFEIGLKPEFSIAPLKNARLVRHVIDITEAMVDRDIDNLRQRAGLPVETATVSDKNAWLNFQFTEVDASGNPVENGIEKEVKLDYEDFSDTLQTELWDKAAGHELKGVPAIWLTETAISKLNSTLELPENDTRVFSATLKKVEVSEPHPLNEELFKQAFPKDEITTAEAFREKIREEIAQYWSAQGRNQLHDQIYHYLIDETAMEFPAAFLKRWLQSGGEKPKTPEEAEAEFPKFSNQLRWMLISEKLISENDIRVSPEEVKEEMRAEVGRYFQGMSGMDAMPWLESYINRMMQDEQQVETTYRKLINTRLFHWAENQVDAKEKSVTVEAFSELMHHHEH